ncbi:MAG: hypothetical protein U9N60_09800 [Thermodesulfobacteriota bacterium]|nr:hypothetical protein [Thermodesulfobacteriota bacterium]
MKIRYFCFFVVLAGLMSISGCTQPVPEKAKDELTLPGKFSEFRLEVGCDDDPVLSDIKRDMQGKTSILDLMNFYLKELEIDAGPDSPCLKKLEKLFACGQIGSRVKGHFYGITLVLKKGNHPHGDLLNQLWTSTVAGVSPWDGKIFDSAAPGQLGFYTDGFENGNVPTFLGINCFKEYKESFLNVAGVAALTFWMNLKDSPEEEKQKYGYDKKGGLFIARKAKSVDPGNPGKEVFQLNYRWRKLENLPPNKYLIDEIVLIADGLYLGQLFYATQHLLEAYDPELNPSEYRYENFGYFLLMDDEWSKERERLFFQ